MHILKVTLTLVVTVLLSAAAVCAQTTPGKLVFSDGIGRLLTINADGSGQTFLTSGGNPFDHNPAFSPDGSKIAFDKLVSGKTNIFIMNADGTSPVAITTDGPFPEASVNEDPAWSPDGTKIAFVSDRGGQGRKEIWLMNVDGSGLIKLTTNVQIAGSDSNPIYGWDTWPAWSPDGSSIAFSSARNSGLTQIYVMNTDGTNQTRIVTPDHESFPSWAPDSQKIVFTTSSFGVRRGINIVNRDGTNEVKVTDNGGRAAWSPDGATLAIMRIESEAFDAKFAIFLINLDGTNARKISSHNLDCLNPSWAPSAAPPIPTFTISGSLVDGSGTPIGAATLTLSGTLARTTQSDATGAYSFTGLPAGNYRIVVTKAGFGFRPPLIDLTNVTTDRTANFTAFVAFTISGRINNPGRLVQVHLSGSQTRIVESDFNGNYVFDTVEAGGNYTITPTTPFLFFVPTSVTVNNLLANQVVNFEASPAFYSISGRITRFGTPVQGATLKLHNGLSDVITTSDANGNYAFSNVPAGGQYQLIAFKGSNDAFFPSGYGFNQLAKNEVADFAVESTNHLLFNTSGFRFGEGPCSLQLTVFRGGNATGVGPITVNYATSDGTAMAGSDYTAVAGTLSFPEGTHSRTISIPILNDSLIEGDETFSVTLSNPTGEVDLAAPSTATFTIADTDTIGMPSLPAEAGSDQAIALNATTFLAAPFKLTTSPNFSTDERTRFSLFVENLKPAVCGFLPSYIVEAENAQQIRFGLEVEAEYKLPGINPYTQLILRLPQNFNSPGDLLIGIRIGNFLSNRVRLSIDH